MPTFGPLRHDAPVPFFHFYGGRMHRDVLGEGKKPREVYPERVAAERNGGPPLPGNHSPLFAPVPKPTIQTGVTAMTLAVLSAFDQRANGQ